MRNSRPARPPRSPSVERSITRKLSYSKQRLCFLLRFGEPTSYASHARPRTWAEPSRDSLKRGDFTEKGTGAGRGIGSSRPRFALLSFNFAAFSTLVHRDGSWRGRTRRTEPVRCG